MNTEGKFGNRLSSTDFIGGTEMAKGTYLLMRCRFNKCRLK